MSFVHAPFLWLLLPLAVYLIKRNRKRTFQESLRWIALALLIVAVARPVIKEAPTKVSLPAHALVVALDLSASMKAQDIQPNRLEASQESIELFLKENILDQIALIGFTMNALLLSPPTTDHTLVSMALRTIKSENILTKGTNLKKLLEKVAKFSDKEKKLILFSDGGDEPIDESLIAFAQDENIKIVAVAMATQQGASVTTKDGSLLQDKKGHIVVSKLNNNLKALAQQSGGIFIHFKTPQDTVEQIESWIQEQKNLNSLEKERHNYFELFFIPTFFALVFLFLSATRFSLKVIALLALLNINGEAEELLKKKQWGENYLRSETFTSTMQNKGYFNGYFDAYYLHQAYQNYEHQDYNSTLKILSNIDVPSLESQLTLAHTYYKLKQYKEAKNILKNIKTTQPKIKQQLLYELGNCEAKLAYYEKAKNYYIEALQLGEDSDALQNLNVVIFQEQKNISKVGFTNPSSPESANIANDNVESKEKATAKQEEQTGSSGGDGSEISKTSTVKVIKSLDARSSKIEMSSKAYDLINEGYIHEENPW